MGIWTFFHRQEPLGHGVPKRLQRQTERLRCLLLSYLTLQILPVHRIRTDLFFDVEGSPHACCSRNRKVAVRHLPPQIVPVFVGRATRVALRVSAHPIDKSTSFYESALPRIQFRRRPRSLASTVSQPFSAGHAARVCFRIPGSHRLKKTAMRFGEDTVSSANPRKGVTHSSCVCLLTEFPFSDLRCLAHPLGCD